jgi:hypothetical protein
MAAEIMSDATRDRTGLGLRSPFIDVPPHEKYKNCLKTESPKKEKPN